MWSREVLKSNAKEVLRVNYWKSVLVSLVLVAVTGGFSGSSYSRGASSTASDLTDFRSGINMQMLFIVISALIGIFIIIFIVSWALQIFAFSPIEVGCQRFFVGSLKEPGDLNQLGFSFKNYYMNIVKVQFLRNLFTGLWTLLFLVPGIIKSYEYRMMPYILAENPSMDSKEVFARSREMMDGNKWDAFVLDLSFFGWILLSLCTCGLLSVFYVSPYQHLTNAGLYEALKQQAGEANPYQAQY